jgi:hypothetical protein
MNRFIARYSFLACAKRVTTAGEPAVIANYTHAYKIDTPHGANSRLRPFSAMLDWHGYRRRAQCWTSAHSQRGRPGAGLEVSKPAGVK